MALCCSQEAKSLVANTITLYPSDQTEQRIGRIIGTSPDFIFYALKGARQFARGLPDEVCHTPLLIMPVCALVAGHIRALYRHANVRTLLRGHTAQVLDIQVRASSRRPGVPFCFDQKHSVVLAAALWR